MSNPLLELCPRCGDLSGEGAIEAICLGCLSRGQALEAAVVNRCMVTWPLVGAGSGAGLGIGAALTLSGASRALESALAGADAGAIHGLLLGATLARRRLLRAERDGEGFGLRSIEERRAGLSAARARRQSGAQLALAWLCVVGASALAIQVAHGDAGSGGLEALSLMGAALLGSIAGLILAMLGGLAISLVARAWSRDRS